MLHYYDKIIYFDFQELWFVSGKRDSRTVFIFHDFLQNGILSTTHALTGCVTTSKVVVTKNKKLLHKAKNLLYYAGKNKLKKIW